MIWKQKYVRTDKDQIIVFPELIQHSQFQNMHPVSAGFISFNYDHELRTIFCQCYGDSFGLKLASKGLEDTKLALTQICGLPYYTVSEVMEKLSKPQEEPPKDDPDAPWNLKKDDSR